MKAFTLCRCIFFALFIILNAINAIVAAWNSASSRNVGFVFQIDTFLIVNGAIGLLVIFPIIFVDLVRRGAFTSRVSFEIAWVAVFWVLNLSGAAAVTAIEPGKTCSAQVPLTSLTDVCTSTHMLMAVSWLLTVILLVYLLGLIVASAIQMKENPRVWHTSVREVDWFAAAPRPLRSQPNSPALPSFTQISRPQPLTYASQPYVAHVKPVPPVPAAAPIVARAPSPPRPIAFVSSLERTAPRRSETAPAASATTPPLYPRMVQNLQARPVLPAGPEPLPAGNWPRANPPEPVPKKQRQATAPPAASGSRSGQSSEQTGGLRPLLLQTASAPAARRGLLGPRSKPPPPPLNLSGLSSHQNSSRGQDRGGRR